MDDVPLGARVSIENLNRSFAEAGPVISSLSMQIESGEFVSLLGPSGCGKSTLLRLIAGLDRSDTGTLAVDSFGRKLFRGFVFQEAHLLPWRTVLDNVLLPLQLLDTSPDESKPSPKERATEALSRVGLEEFLGFYPNQLSGGMKMRVSVARALVTRPSLLLLDEPFAALDERTRFRLQEDLRSLWETLGMTVVFVTHSVSEAVFLSNRAIVLSARPAQILLDHRVGLPDHRDEETRRNENWNHEIEILSAAMEER